MTEKVKKKLNYFLTKLKPFSEIYIDYILCVTFLNIIILKLNQILFKIPSIYLYPMIIFISVVFINELFLITNKIKNTYVFNFILYYFLSIKNYIYRITFECLDFIEKEINQNFLVFSIGFLLSSFFLNLLFLIANKSYNLSVLLFIFLLIINIFNLIEKKFIFPDKNINRNVQNFDYNHVKNILMIKNKKFNKNKSLFYIQKRYINNTEILKAAKRLIAPLITGATGGTLIVTYLQFSQLSVSKEQLELDKNSKKEQLLVSKEQLELDKNSKKEQLEIQKKNLKIEVEKLKVDIVKQNDDRINALDEKISTLNKKIHKMQTNMDNRYFWNKVDFSKSIENLEEEKKILMRRRLNFEPQQIEVNVDNLLED